MDAGQRRPCAAVVCLACAGQRLASAGSVFEAQKHPGDWNVPDYFLRLDTSFDTSFGYSRALKLALSASYLGSQSELREQGVDLGWRVPGPSHADTAAGVQAVFESFATHHAAYLRYLAVVLEPERVTSPEAFIAWVDAAMAASTSPALRLVLVDTYEDPRWQPLLDRHARAHRIAPQVDMFDIGREIAAQSGGAGPAVAYRQLLSDLMLVLERGSAAQLAQRIERPMALAQRHGWSDQQVVLSMMLAGGWLKEKHYPAAISSYRQARDHATQALTGGHPAARDLLMQGWFGEAGTWFAAGQPDRAVQGYLSAAQTAAEIPNPMFVIEAYRMAAFCLAQDGQREAARNYGLEAVRCQTAAKRGSPLHHLAANPAGPACTARQAARTQDRAVCGDLSAVGEHAARAGRTAGCTTGRAAFVGAPGPDRIHPACWTGTRVSSSSPGTRAFDPGATNSSARWSRSAVNSCIPPGMACRIFAIRWTTRFPPGPNRRRPNRFRIPPH